MLMNYKLLKFKIKLGDRTMGLFKRKVGFQTAICPKCGGNLEMDSKLKIAICKNCGVECIVKNAPKVKNKSKFEMVFDYFEKQQALKRKDKKEQEQKIEDEKRKKELQIEKEKIAKEQEKKERELKRKEHFKKYWWAYLIGFIVLMVLSYVINYFEGGAN